MSGSLIRRRGDAGAPAFVTLSPCLLVTLSRALSTGRSITSKIRAAAELDFWRTLFTLLKRREAFGVLTRVQPRRIRILRVLPVS